MQPDPTPMQYWDADLDPHNTPYAKLDTLVPPTTGGLGVDIDLDRPTYVDYLPSAPRDYSTLFSDLLTDAEAPSHR